MNKRQGKRDGVRGEGQGAGTRQKQGKGAGVRQKVGQVEGGGWLQLQSNSRRGENA